MSSLVGSSLNKCYFKTRSPWCAPLNWTMAILTLMFVNKILKYNLEKACVYLSFVSACDGAISRKKTFWMSTTGNLHNWWTGCGVTIAEVWNSFYLKRALLSTYKGTGSKSRDILTVLAKQRNISVLIRVREGWGRGCSPRFSLNECVTPKKVRLRGLES